jgi:uncharacterized protein YegL
MIVLDDTGSVRTEWEQQRDFVAKVVGTPSEQSFNNGRVTLGLVTFTTSATLVIPFADSQNKTETLKTLSDVDFIGGGTSTLSGVRTALTEIQRYKPSGNIVPKLIVLIVGDGNSGVSDTFPLIEEAAKQLFDTGATTYAVTFSDDYYMPELRRYTGSEQRVYTPKQLDKFKSDILATANPPECQQN